MMAASGKVSVAGLKAGITRAARAYNGSLSASCLKAFDAYHLDKIAAAEVHDLMAHAEKMLADIQRKTTEVQRSAQNILSAEKGTVFIS